MEYLLIIQLQLAFNIAFMVLILLLRKKIKNVEKEDAEERWRLHKDIRGYKDVVKISFNKFKQEVEEMLLTYKIAEMNFVDRITDNLTNKLFKLITRQATIKPKPLPKKIYKKVKK